MSKSSEQWIIPSQYDKECFLEHFEELWTEHGYLRIEINTAKQRTPRQRKALQVFCEHLAEALNNAGFDLRRFFEKRSAIDIPWTMDLVKQYLWKPLQFVVVGKESTAEANTTDYGKTYDVINRFFATEFGIHVPWPGYSFECPMCKGDYWLTLKSGGVEYGVCKGWIEIPGERHTRCQFTWKRSDDKSVLKINEG